MEKKKKFPHDNDPILKMYLTKHLFLISVNKRLLELAGNEDYENVKIPERDVEIDATEELGKVNISSDHIGPNMAALVEEKYLRLLSDDNKVTMYFKITEKGFIAMTTGLFYREYEARQRDLLQTQLAESTKRTNTWMVLLTLVLAITAVSEFIRGCVQHKEPEFQNIKIEGHTTMQSEQCTDTFPLKRGSTTLIKDSATIH